MITIFYCKLFIALLFDVIRKKMGFFFHISNFSSFQMWRVAVREEKRNS